MKYGSKKALLDDIRKEHDALSSRLSEIPKARWQEPGVWGDEWSLSDLVAHLAEWHHLFLNWYEAGLRGVKPEMPAPGYKWNETPKLNQAIFRKHRSRPAAALQAEFESGYQRILQIADSLSSAQLLKPGHFEWTGKHPLSAYIAPNTASHYRFAIKATKRWLRAGS